MTQYIRLKIYFKKQKCFCLICSGLSANFATWYWYSCVSHQQTCQCEAHIVTSHITGGSFLTKHVLLRLKVTPDDNKNHCEVLQSFLLLLLFFSTVRDCSCVIRRHKQECQKKICHRFLVFTFDLQDLCLFDVVWIIVVGLLISHWLPVGDSPSAEWSGCWNHCWMSQRKFHYHAKSFSSLMWPEGHPGPVLQQLCKTLSLWCLSTAQAEVACKQDRNTFSSSVKATCHSYHLPAKFHTYLYCYL